MNTTDKESKQNQGPDNPNPFGKDSKEPYILGFK
jgi:hypothetical protein